MKKIVLVVAVLCLAFSFALAEDLSGLSFDQLLALRASVEMEIFGRPEWKQTTIPVGEWVIGVDIPAGYYSVSALDRLAIISAAAPSSKFDDFYHVIAAGGSVGKVYFVDGSVFKNSAQVILAPPVGLDF